MEMLLSFNNLSLIKANGLYNIPRLLEVYLHDEDCDSLEFFNAIIDFVGTTKENCPGVDILNIYDQADLPEYRQYTEFVVLHEEVYKKLPSVKLLKVDSHYDDFDEHHAWALIANFLGRLTALEYHGSMCPSLIDSPSLRSLNLCCALSLFTDPVVDVKHLRKLRIEALPGEINNRVFKADEADIVYSDTLEHLELLTTITISDWDRDYLPSYSIDWSKLRFPNLKTLTISNKQFKGRQIDEFIRKYS